MSLKYTLKGLYYINKSLYSLFRVYGDMGEQAEACRVNPSAEGGRIRGDGRCHQGGRRDRGILSAKENATFSEFESRFFVVRMFVVLS